MKTENMHWPMDIPDEDEEVVEEIATRAKKYL